MKNQIKNQDKNKPRKITVELHPDDYAGIEKMADMLGATVEQTAEALLWGQSEDYLGREGEEIWEDITNYIAEAYGSSPKLRLYQRYIAANQANGQLPSIAERHILFGSGEGVLSSLKSYVDYLAKIGADEQDIDMVGAL